MEDLGTTSRDLPRGKGSRLDADMLGGKDSSLYHDKGSHLEMKALPDPQAPVSGSSLYTRVNGSGKHELCILFPTGIVQVISTQP